jgi:hypothetical protein
MLAVSLRVAFRKLVFTAIGESSSGQSAAEADEMLAEGFGRD